MPRHLAAVAPDGGAPEGMRFLGPRIREPVNYLSGDGERQTTWFDHLAFSPDGEWIYLNQAGDSARFKRQHGVFRLKWTDPMPAEPFVGKAEPGADDAHFSDPQGIAADKDGRLYVCDRGNNRVVIFSPEGKRLGQFAVDTPEQVAVHPAGGELYVLSRAKDQRGRGKPETVLRKFPSWGQGDVKEQAALQLKNVELIAVDPAAKPARLWLALSTGWGRPYELRPVEDRGDKLEAGAPVTSQAGLEHPCELAADPARNRVILRERDAVFLSRRFFQLDLAGGKKTPLKLSDLRQGPPIALDRDGNLYVAGDYSSEVACSRYDPAGKPLPFPATGKHQIAESPRNPHWSRGIAVAPDGTIYVLRNLVRHQSGQLDVYSPDGKLRKADLVPGLDRGSNGLGVDAAGNVYVGMNLKPKDQPYPPEFMGKVPPKPWWFWFKGKLFGDRPEPWTGTFYNPYLYHWGGIVKFGPEGGSVYGLRNLPKGAAKAGEAEDPYTRVAKAPEGAAAYVTACLEQEVRVAGARWFRPGFGIVASSLMSWGDPCCLCSMSGFGVDAYGRVFYPNPFRFCVEALDPAGNLLLRAGHYGNADSAGPGSKLPEPEIAFAWPAFVSLAGGKLYVSDSINQRVVVVRLDHAAEASCELK